MKSDFNAKLTAAIERVFGVTPKRKTTPKRKRVAPKKPVAQKAVTIHNPLLDAKVGEILLVNRNVFSTTPGSVDFYQVVSDGQVRRMTRQVHHNDHGGITSVSGVLPFETQPFSIESRLKLYRGVRGVHWSKWSGRPYSVTDPRSI